jgi:hypothetical protein
VKRTRIPLIAAVAASLLLGSVVVVTAQDAETDVAAPVEFTSEYSFSHQPDPGDPEALEGGGTRFLGRAWQFRLVETSDPRFDGALTFTTTVDEYPGGVEVSSEAARIDGDGGVWQEVPVFYLDFARTTGDTVDRILIGEGAYEGLFAAVTDTWTSNGFEFHGFIIEGGPPPIAEPWSAE